MHLTAHRCLRRPGLPPGPLPFALLKPLRRERGLLVALVLGVPGAGCAVDDAEPGYERVCRVDYDAFRGCVDVALPGLLREAERDCMEFHKKYDDTYLQLLADCYEPLTCEERESSVDEACPAQAQEDTPPTSACVAACDALGDAEDDLCDATYPEDECLFDFCIFDASVLSKVTECRKANDCESYGQCIAAALD